MNSLLPFGPPTIPSSPKGIHTRFRAYQLGEEGSCFSYYAAGKFTLLEARVTKTSIRSLTNELGACNCSQIHTLHITSWDRDHCGESDLAWILENLTPTKIEYPGYTPHTDCARSNRERILDYKARQQAKRRDVTIQAIDPPFIRGLEKAQGMGYRDVFYHPKQLYEQSNNNSTVKLFRSGMFNVASLGDIEHPNIGSMLRRCRIFSGEIDVLILAHHGADNGITTKTFLEEVEPTLAICGSNYDNQFDHPKPEIRELLFDQGIPIYTTKTGDVLIQSIESHIRRYQVVNLIGDSTQVSSAKIFEPKKAHLLSMNADTIRNRYQPGFKGLKKPY